MATKRKQIVLNGIVVGEHDSTGNYDEDIIAIRAYLKERGLWNEVSVNDSMFGQANSFAETANLLYRTGLRRSPFKGSVLSPFVVNAAFSIEIYLKTIHDVYGNACRGHDLVNLYSKLNGEARRFVSDSARDVRPRYKLAERTTFSKALEALSSAFTDWRYRYEHDKLTLEIQSVRFAMNSMFEATRLNF